MNGVVVKVSVLSGVFFLTPLELISFFFLIIITLFLEGRLLSSDEVAHCRPREHTFAVTPIITVVLNSQSLGALPPYSQYSTSY